MSEFKKTEAQKLATKILAGPAKHIALSGGSRSWQIFSVNVCNNSQMLQGKI